MNTAAQFRILSVTATLIKVEYIRPKIFNQDFNIGSYIKIPTSDNIFLVGIIESFIINTEIDKKEAKNKSENENDEDKTLSTKSFVLDIQPVGTLKKDNKKVLFQRGYKDIPIPPVDDVQLISDTELEQIYNSNLEKEEKFVFSKLSQNETIEVPINGNRFFNKHIAIVGATGSGKSHTTAKIIQEALKLKNGEYSGLNNSHIIIFDIHSEYKQAFPEANFISIKDIILPYWLLTSEELEELFIDTEANDHNQRNEFNIAVVDSKIKHFKGNENDKKLIHLDSVEYFDIVEVYNHIYEKNRELKQGDRGLIKGDLNGKLGNFERRLNRKLNDKRLNFLLGDECKKISFEETLQQFTGYKFRKNDNANVTIIDLSGIPFEVLSITVSLISRMLFEFSYFYKKIKERNGEIEIKKIVEVPILLVFEEAHKYVPQSDLVKYRASKHSIERIAKEGRKYGISLLIASQRPSEVSTTIFAQCNNFIAMRLTNPDDQNYVKKLLPDTLGGLTSNLPILRTGEALLIGDAIEIPSIVQIDRCNPEPSSSDVPYLEKWSEQWKDIDFNKIVKDWEK